MEPRFRIFTLGLVVLVLAGSLFVAGCTDNRGSDTGTTPPPQVTTVAEKKVPSTSVPETTPGQGDAVKAGGKDGDPAGDSGRPTCAQIGGSAIDSGQTCKGTLSTAADTSRCCLPSSSGKGSSDGQGAATNEGTILQGDTSFPEPGSFTCAKMGGMVLSSGQNCRGDGIVINASDTSRCCIVKNK